MKKLWFVPVVSMLAFAACSSESSNEPDFGGDGEIKGFIPMSINAYEIDDDMNVIKTAEPVCKEEKRELVWAKAGTDTAEYDYKYDSDKGLVYLGEGKDNIQFDYLGSKFPEGAWRMSTSDTADGKFITEGMVFGSDKVEAGIAYSGNCFLEDIYAGEITGEISEDADDSTAAMMEGVMKYIKIDCDKVTMGDSIEVKIGSWSRDGIETKYTFGKESCTNVVSTRFAYYEKDCKAAYDEFKETAESGSEFDFEDYSTANSNQECYEAFTKYAMTYIMQKVLEDALGGLLGGDDDDSDFNLDDLLNAFGGEKEAKVLSAKKVAKKVASLKAVK